MNNKEKKQLKEIISKLENSQVDIQLLISQEENRLDAVCNYISQFERANKLENNIDNLERAEDCLSDAIMSLEQIIN